MPNLNAKVQAGRRQSVISLKVSEKGGISAYGLGQISRHTLQASMGNDSWTRDETSWAFIKANKDSLVPKKIKAALTKAETTGEKILPMVSLASQLGSLPEADDTGIPLIHLRTGQVKGIRISALKALKAVPASRPFFPFHLPVAQ